MFDTISQSLGLWYDDGTRAIAEGWVMALLVGCSLQFLRMLIQAFKTASSTHTEK